MLLCQLPISAGFSLSHYHRVGRVGGWRPSWAPTPIPSGSTEALPSSSRSGDTIFLVLVFAQTQESALRVLLLPPGPRSTFYYSGQRVAPPLKGIHQLLCVPGPSTAVNLIVESVSVTEEGSRATPARRDLMSFPLPRLSYQLSFSALIDGCYSVLGDNWECWRLLCACPGTGCGKYAHWPGEATGAPVSELSEGPNSSRATMKHASPLGLTPGPGEAIKFH